MSTLLNLIDDCSLGVSPPLLNSASNIPSENKFWIPKSHVTVNDVNIVVRVELYDVDVHDFTLNVNKEGYIILRGDKKKNKIPNKKSGVSGHFYRRYYFGANIDVDKVVAHFDDGILKITIPKKDITGLRRVYTMSKL